MSVSPRLAGWLRGGRGGSSCCSGMQGGGRGCAGGYPRLGVFTDVKVRSVKAIGNTNYHKLPVMVLRRTKRSPDTSSSNHDSRMTTVDAYRRRTRDLIPPPEIPDGEREPPGHPYLEVPSRS